MGETYISERNSNRQKNEIVGTTKNRFERALETILISPVFEVFKLKYNSNDKFQKPFCLDIY